MVTFSFPERSPDSLLRKPALFTLPDTSLPLPKLPPEEMPPRVQEKLLSAPGPTHTFPATKPAPPLDSLTDPAREQTLEPPENRKDMVTGQPSDLLPERGAKSKSIFHGVATPLAFIGFNLSYADL